MHRQHLQRWAIERADFRNAHFTGQRWQVADFLGGPREKAKSNRPPFDEVKEMISVKLANTFKPTDDDLPAWARMTDTEKQQRGLN